MKSERIDLPQGALELLILRTLARRSEHGYAIAKRIKEGSQGALAVEEGSLYPALHRLERQGRLEAEWGVSESGRRAKFYALTRDGRKQLERSRQSWERMTSAIGLVLGGGA
jgi:transcriptional regulator